MKLKQLAAKLEPLFFKEQWRWTMEEYGSKVPNAQEIALGIDELRDIMYDNNADSIASGRLLLQRGENDIIDVYVHIGELDDN